jgi:hypothetical protein
MGVSYPMVEEEFGAILQLFAEFGGGQEEAEVVDTLDLKRVAFFWVKKAQLAVVRDQAALEVAMVL